MNKNTGEIREFTDEELKALPKKERRQWIPLTDDEAVDLSKMTPAERIGWKVRSKLQHNQDRTAHAAAVQPQAKAAKPGAALAAALALAEFADRRI